MVALRAKLNIHRYANHSGHPNLVLELRPVDDDGNNDAAAAAAADSVAGSAGAGTVFPNKEGVAMTTLRDVEEGEELTFDYGEE